MKRCPECRRDYTDETLSYCLDDGAPLLDGPLKQITDFKSDLLFSFAFSRDGTQIAFSRGTISSDVVLFKDIR